MILRYEEDPFNGVVISNTDLPAHPGNFARTLQDTVVELRTRSYTKAWLQLPPDLSDLITPSLRVGFIYHHADSSGVLLVLAMESETTIPGYATHFIGVGGVVINEKRQILVIQEQHHQQKHYKLPGGAVDPGEHIADAAVREVFEETGVRSEFTSLHCFRHWHGYRYGKSDIYFVCRMRPLTEIITIDPVEIFKAVWMPVEDYLNDAETHPFNSKIVRTALNTEGLKRENIPGYGSDETHEMMF